MLATKSFIGKRLDMEHYKNVFMDRTIEIYDELGDGYNLGNDSVHFELFAKEHGKSLQVLDLESEQNEVIFHGQVLNYRKGYYWHECYQITGDSPGEKVLLFYGVSELI
jgi:hypothetical protein